MKCLFGFHKWKRVYRPIKKEFLGEEYTELEECFRVCEECGKAQSVDRFPMWGRVYYDLSDKKRDILISKVRDCGAYYILDEEK